MTAAGLARRLKRYAVTGVLVLAPISISVSLLVVLVRWVDGVLSALAWPLTGSSVPGLGLATAVAIILVVGWLGSNIIGQQVFEAIEDLLLHVPVLRWFYKTAKQLTEVFTPGGNAAFRSVVLVEYPREGVFQLGFATGRFDAPDGGQLTSVFIPTNHLYIGDIVLVPTAKLKDSGLTLQQGIQFYLSVGAAAPHEGGLPPAGQEGPAAERGGASRPERAP